jgi:predicted nucleic acid-binding protein
MIVWSDSSFLVALYTDSRDASRAGSHLASQPIPITLTDFSRAEAQHAIRLSSFRGDISHAEMTRALLRFERDQAEGLYEYASIEPVALFEKATQLSHRYALTQGTRFLDVLHVAAALLTKSRRFLTFDQRQARLARAAGLDVRP